MIPIFCCGESEADRKNDQAEEKIQQQLEEGLFHLSPQKMEKIIIGYEPVWAIGTGNTASPEQAQAMHHHIRQLITDQYNTDIGQQLSLLYGGSCKPHNAASLFEQPDIDGGLIGGASLKAPDFADICTTLENL